MWTEAERRIHRLAKFLDWLLQNNEAGLNILLGTLPPLSAYDIYEMKRGALANASYEELGTRITGGTGGNLAETVIDAALREEQIVNDAGGWEVIIAAVREYRLEQPKNWQFFYEHSLYVRPGGAIHDGEGGVSAELQRKFGGISARTMRRRRNRILRAIANRIYMKDGELHDDKENYLTCHERDSL